MVHNTILQDLEKACIRKAIVYPQWLPNSSSVFWYKREIDLGKFQFILVDCIMGTRRLAFDHNQLAAELSKLIKKEVKPDNLPFWWINIAPNAAWICFQFDGQTWRYEKSGALEVWDGKFDTCNIDYGCVEVPSPLSRQMSSLRLKNHTANRIIYSWINESGMPQYYGTLSVGQVLTQNSYVGHIWRLTVQDSGENIACTVKEQPFIAIIEELPSGISIIWEAEESNKELDSVTDTSCSSKKPEAFVRDYNIWVRTSDGNETAISYDAFTDNEFKEIYQSMDGHYAVAWQCKSQPKHFLHILESSPKDQLRPKLSSRSNLNPGDDVEVQRPRLFDLFSCKEIVIDNTMFHNPYALTHIGWSEDCQSYRFIFNERGHQNLRLLEIELNGNITVLVEESSTTFIDYAHKLYYKIMVTANELLWASERDGWNHLYLIDPENVNIQKQITKGPWVMRSIEWVDEDKRQVWFRGFGMVPEQDPYYAHLARVNLDGSDLRIITEGNGTHTWTWGPSKQFIIDSWSRVDCSPQTVVRIADTGKKVVSLEKGQLQPLLEAGWISPEIFVAPGRDEYTSIYGIIIRPNNFDASKKYPVLERIYAGPQGFYTPKTFQSLPKLRRVADQGYILVCLDGMGTNWRSKAFHDVCYKNLKDAGFPDRIPWIRAAAKTRPWMDLSRVGCYGNSAGGQNAAAAVIHHSSFYKAASAAAGCHDNRIDKLWWNELWMGYPVDDSYQSSSNIAHAHKLGGHLLLVVGEMDKDLDPSLTMRLAHALIEAEKDFDLVFVPGGSHQVIELPFVIRKQDEFFNRHLLDS